MERRHSYKLSTISISVFQYFLLPTLVLERQLISIDTWTDRTVWEIHHVRSWEDAIEMLNYKWFSPLDPVSGASESGISKEERVTRLRQSMSWNSLVKVFCPVARPRGLRENS